MNFLELTNDHCDSLEYFNLFLQYLSHFDTVKHRKNHILTFLYQLQVPLCFCYISIDICSYIGAKPLNALKGRQEDTINMKRRCYNA